jgi:hypothetical protein
MCVCVYVYMCVCVCVWDLTSHFKTNTLIEVVTYVCGKNQTYERKVTESNRLDKMIGLNLRMIVEK